MEIKSYNKKGLTDFINSDFFRNLSTIPISYHRAISQINNPHSSEDDILLWAAYDDESLIGYIGVLPDLISINEVQTKLYWVSCFWVDDKFRTKELASQLLYLLIKQYKTKLYITNYLFNLDKMYQALGIFSPTQYLIGKTFYRNLDFSDLILSRFPKVKKLIPAYKLIEKASNFVWDLLWFNKIKNQSTNHTIIESRDIDNELELFLTNNKENTFHRSTAYFEWILNYPWILAGESDSESKKYYFSSKSQQFEYCALKIYNSTKLIGFCFGKIRDSKLTFGYIYLPDNCINDVSLYILLFAKRNNILSVTCFDSRMISYFNTYKGFIFKKIEKKPFIFPKKSDLNINILQAGDGDSIFT